MHWQALSVKSETLKEQLLAESFDLETVLNNIDDNTSASSLSQFIEKLETKIRRLGAINLAAIDEFEQQSVRKKYLDDQNMDLERALETLNGAIRKIDRENTFKI